MTDAEKAYARAQAIIAQAKADGADHVSFDEAACQALAEIPPEIATLDRVRQINLCRTQVADLTPLAAMTAMQALVLS